MRRAIDRAIEWVADHTIHLMVGVCVVLVPLVIYAAVQERKRWNAFAEAHDCRVVERIAARIVQGSGYVGGKYVTTTTTEPERVAFKCDDGVTYWR